MNLSVFHSHCEESWPSRLYSVTLLRFYLCSKSVWFNSRLWLGHCNILILLHWKRPAGTLGVIVTHDPSNGLNFSIKYFGMQSSWSTQGAQTAALQTQIHHPSTTVLDSWCGVFVPMCCVWFSPNVTLWNMAQHLHIGLFIWNIAKLSCAANVLLRSKRLFFPVTSQNKPYLFSLFLFVLSRTLTVNIPTEACGVWDITALSDLGVNLMSWMFSSCE